MTSASRDRLVAGGFAFLLFLAFAASQSASVIDRRELLGWLTVVPIAVLHLLAGAAAISPPPGEKIGLAFSFLLSAMTTAFCLLMARAVLAAFPVALARGPAQLAGAASVLAAFALGWFAHRQQLSRRAKASSANKCVG